MRVANRRWPFVVLGVSFIMLGFLHLIAWLVMIFIYHANAIPGIDRAYLPAYGLLGTTGVRLFLITILLDLVAGILLLTSRGRGRGLVFLCAILNLPLIPLGSLVGAAAVLLLISVRNPR